MTSKAQARDALHHFISDVSIPETIVVDNALEKVAANSEFNKVCQQYKVKQCQTEPYML